MSRLAKFVDAVRGCNLLAPADVAALEAAAAAPDVDPEAVVRGVVSQKLLTPYQAKTLWRGKGSDLFLNQYVLVEPLGEGGMGRVYRAKHTRMDRDVALKIMRKEKMASADAVKRFRREIRAAATLSHENVVMAYDADQLGDVHFFAMEYVAGTTLDRLVREKGPRPVAEACDCVLQAAAGLQHAHEQGLIHRDIKPGNLLVDESGTVKISDFGLVLIDEDTDSRITKEGLTVGTPDYVSPEQARNPRSADIRADIYSLGCTFYYLLMGDVPFPGGTPTEKMLRQSREPVPEPTREDVPDGVKAVLAKMTAKKPEQRYSTPAEVVAALEPFSTRRGTSLNLPAVPPPITEPLTQDELPEMPPTLRPRNRGCLGMVLALATLTFLAARTLAGW